MNAEEKVSKSESETLTENIKGRLHLDKCEELLDNIHYDEALNYLVEYRYLYLLLAVAIVLGVPLLSMYWQGQPLLGTESYYHLSQAQEINWKNYYYYPLNLAQEIMPSWTLSFIPLALAFFSVILGLKLAKRLELSDHFIFLYLALLIISPVFILTFITISTYSYFISLILIGLWLLSSHPKLLQYLALIPLMLATALDLFSSLFLLLTLLVYYYYSPEKDKEEHCNMVKLILIIIAVTALSHYLFFDTPLSLGPFHNYNLLSDLVSDLGGLSGISLFALLLTVGGLIYTWKEKSYYWGHLFILLTIPLYIYRPQYLFLLTISLLPFSSSGFIRMFERRWNLDSIKKFTTLLVILGLLFSTLTYLNRVTDLGPAPNEIEALTWLKENVPEERAVFSIPENSEYIRYFAQKEPISSFRDSPGQAETALNILNSSYTSTTFPLLDKNNISIIYFSPRMKPAFPSGQGLILVLRNEKFKMVHSSGDAEVWMYKQGWPEESS
ncbi:hypothetical protein HZC30_06065 [Candidatus Woesearchaeota archaeon]|nr:hypothetical protein [Candidatus Woesearchaeota archaeon]